jgi:transketolase
VTVHECLAAADRLERDGIHTRVIDLYSVKPIDTATLVAAVEVTHGRIVVAEDHHPEGGLGSAVADTLLAERVPPLQFTHLAVREMPGSGTTAELLHAAGIDADAIEAAARNLLKPVLGE